MYFKNLIKCFLTSLILILTLSLVVSMLNYFNVLSDNITNVFEFIILAISLFVGSFALGRKSKTKGFLEGLKFSGIFIFIFFIFNLILKLGFNIDTFITYIIVILSSLFGSVIGINRK